MRAPTLGRRLYSILMFIVVSILGGVLVAGLALPGTAIAVGTVDMAATAMDTLPAELTVTRPPQGSTMYAADGTELGQFFEQYRVVVPLEQIAPIMRTAQIGIEDQRFYEHGALDARGTLRALVRSSSGSAQGGSTLTQQYVKLALLYDAAARNDTVAVEAANSRTVNRKILELRYAIALEKKLSKDQILDNYLNIAYFGDQAYGVEAASEHFFGVHASELTLPQAAMLAGIVRNPVTTNPIVNPAAAHERMSNVLDRLVEIKAINASDAEQAKQFQYDKSKVQPIPARGCSASKYPHVCDYAYKTMLTLPSLGKTSAERTATINTGGLTIKTTVDPRYQDVAQAAVSGFVAPTDAANAVESIVQPGTGKILAMAQSKPEIGSKPGQTFLNMAATTALGGSGGFEGGSTFKAFALTAAVTKFMADPAANQQFDPINARIDSPDTKDFPPSTKWQGCAGQFTIDNGWHSTTGESGTYNMYDGTTMSSNTYFATLELEVGVCDTVKAAEALGLVRADEANLETGMLPNGKTLDQLKLRADGMSPTFVVGNVPIAPVSLANAYATLAARGMRCDTTILAEITGPDGKALAVPAPNCQQTVPQGVADRVNDIMHGPFSKWGTAEKAMVPGYLVSGKTGTQKNAPTILTNAYTPDIATSALLSVDPKTDEAKAKKTSGGAYQVTGIVVHGTNFPQGYTIQGKSGTEVGGQIVKPTFQALLPLLPNTKFVAVTPSPYAGAETNADIAQMQVDGRVKLGGTPPSEQSADSAAKDP